MVAKGLAATAQGLPGEAMGFVWNRERTDVPFVVMGAITTIRCDEGAGESAARNTILAERAIERGEIHRTSTPTSCST